MELNTVDEMKKVLVAVSPEPSFLKVNIVLRI